MSVISVGYKVDLDVCKKASLTDRQEAFDLAMLELSEERDPTDNDKSVIRRLLGLSGAEAEGYLDLAAGFRWFCRAFGEPIHSDHLVMGIYNLELSTKLLEYQPPCGFPAPDENVSWTPLRQVNKELTDNGGCVESAANVDLKKQRIAYLKWLEECSRAGRDLVVIES